MDYNSITDVSNKHLNLSAFVVAIFVCSWTGCCVFNKIFCTLGYVRNLIEVRHRFHDMGIFFASYKSISVKYRYFKMWDY